MRTTSSTRADSVDMGRQCIVWEGWLQPCDCIRASRLPYGEIYNSYNGARSRGAKLSAFEHDQPTKLSGRRPSHCPSRAWHSISRSLFPQMPRQIARSRSSKQTARPRSSKHTHQSLGQMLEAKVHKKISSSLVARKRDRGNLATGRHPVHVPSSLAYIPCMCQVRWLPSKDGFRV
jgi:hypothetical protein